MWSVCVARSGVAVCSVEGLGQAGKVRRGVKHGLGERMSVSAACGGASRELGWIALRGGDWQKRCGG